MFFLLFEYQFIRLTLILLTFNDDKYLKLILDMGLRNFLNAHGVGPRRIESEELIGWLEIKSSNLLFEKAITLLFCWLRQDFLQQIRYLQRNIIY